MNKKSTQITLDSFLNISIKSTTCALQEKISKENSLLKVPEYKPKKTILKININLAKKIIEPIDNIKEDIFNNYKREGKNISRDRVNSYFTIFNDPKVLEIVSLFERPFIP